MASVGGDRRHRVHGVKEPLGELREVAGELDTLAGQLGRRPGVQECSLGEVRSGEFGERLGSVLRRWDRWLSLFPVGYRPPTACLPAVFIFAGENRSAVSVALVFRYILPDG